MEYIVLFIFLIIIFFIIYKIFWHNILKLFSYIGSILSSHNSVVMILATTLIVIVSYYEYSLNTKIDSRDAQLKIIKIINEIEDTNINLERNLKYYFQSCEKLYKNYVMNKKSLDTFDSTVASNYLQLIISDFKKILLNYEIIITLSQIDYFNKKDFRENIGLAYLKHIKTSHDFTKRLMNNHSGFTFLGIGVTDKYKRNQISEHYHKLKKLFELRYFKIDMIPLYSIFSVHINFNKINKINKIETIDGFGNNIGLRDRINIPFDYTNTKIRYGYEDSAYPSN